MPAPSHCYMCDKPASTKVNGVPFCTRCYDEVAPPLPASTPSPADLPCTDSPCLCAGAHEPGDALPIPLAGKLCCWPDDDCTCPVSDSGMRNCVNYVAEPLIPKPWLRQCGVKGCSCGGAAIRDIVTGTVTPLYGPGHVLEGT